MSFDPQIVADLAHELSRAQTRYEAAKREHDEALAELTKVRTEFLTVVQGPLAAGQLQVPTLEPVSRPITEVLVDEPLLEEADGSGVTAPIERRYVSPTVQRPGIRRVNTDGTMSRVVDQ